MSTPGTLATDPSGVGNPPAFHVDDEHEHDHASGSSNLIGFWVYLMSDALIFAALFVTYAVLGVRYAGGYRPSELFDLSLVGFNTAIMLVSSFTCGLAMVETGRKRAGPAIAWLAVTAALGACFLASQVTEYAHFAALGATIDASAFLSAFYVLVGTHGLHVVAGLIWALTLIAHLLLRGMDAENRNRVVCFSMFWNFLDITWICVFTFVYLMGLLR